MWIPGLKGLNKEYDNDDDYPFLVLMDKNCYMQLYDGSVPFKCYRNKHKPSDKGEGKEETKLNPLGTLYLPMSTRNVKTQE